MKKIIIFIAVCLMSGTNASYAQITKEQRKEGEEISKAFKSQLNEKAIKNTNKKAKKMKKDGWQTYPDALFIENQLDKSYMMQHEYDEEMNPQQIMGVAMSIGGYYDAANIQALELAKQNLAGHIQTEVAAPIENSVAIEQLQVEKTYLFTLSIMAEKNLISQSLGPTMPLVEVYLTLPNKIKKLWFA